MKLAGYSTNANPTKGEFDKDDGNLIRLDLLQGAHGRAFCGGSVYELPDPRVQLVTVKNKDAVLEITSKHGSAYPLGDLLVQKLRLSGDVVLPVLQVSQIELNHGGLEATEISGHPDGDAVDAFPIREIHLNDSRISCKGDLNFLNVVGDDNRDSYVKAGYLEGATMQGKLHIQANHLMVGILEAREVQVTQADGCTVGQIFCDRILHRKGVGATSPTKAVYDSGLAEAMASFVNIASADDIRENVPSMEIG